MKRVKYLIASVAFVLLAVAVPLVIQRQSADAAPSQPQPSGRTFHWVQESANSGVERHIGLSYDSRYIMFQSNRADLVTGDTNGKSDVFIKDTVDGGVERVSVADDESEYPNDSTIGSMSTNGRYIIFSQDFTGNPGQIMMRDRVEGTTTLVSSDASGNYANGRTAPIMVTDDGKFVVFTSLSASNLDPTGYEHSIVYRKNTQTGEMVKLNFYGHYTSGHDWHIDWGFMSADGSKTFLRVYDLDDYTRDMNGEVIKKLVRIDSASPNNPSFISESTNLKANGSVTYANSSRNGDCVVYGTYATNLTPDSGNDLTAEKLLVSGSISRRRVDKAPTSTVLNGETRLRYRNQAISHTMIDDNCQRIGYKSLATNLDSGNNPTAVNDITRRESLYLATVNSSTITNKLIANQVVRGSSAHAPGAIATNQTNAYTFAFTTDDDIDSADPGGTDIYWTGQRSRYALPAPGAVFYSLQSPDSIRSVNLDGTGDTKVGGSDYYNIVRDVKFTSDDVLIFMEHTAGGGILRALGGGYMTWFDGSACKSGRFYADDIGLACLRSPVSRLTRLSIFHGTISPGYSVAHPYEVLNQGLGLLPDDEHAIVSLRHKTTGCTFLAKVKVANYSVPTFDPLNEATCGGGMDPDVSPDGSKVAYLLSGDVWIMDIDGSNPHKIRDKASGSTITNSNLYSPRWSNDGSQLLITSRYEDSSTPGEDGKIIAIDPTTGVDIAIIKDGLKNPRSAIWSNPVPIP